MAFSLLRSYFVSEAARVATMDFSSRFDSLPILHITDLLSSVKSLRRILQGTLRPASRQSSMTISLGHLFFVLVIMARIVCAWT